MFVTLVKRALPVQVLGTVTLGAVLVLIAGLAGATAPLTAVAIAAATAAAVPGVALVCLGMAVRVTFRGMGACRCVGMLGLGVLAGGLTAAVLPVVGAANRPRVVVAGLVVATGLSLLGLLQVPRVIGSWSARLRLALDGIVVGAALTMVGWLLVPGVSDGHQPVYLAAAIAVTCTAVTAGAMLRAAPTEQRDAMLRCGLGVALAVAGLALLVATIGLDSSHWGLLAATALVVAGPPVVWAGARRVQFAPAAPAGPDGWPDDLREPGLDEAFRGHPMLAVPVALAVLATAYHLVVWGVLDQTAICLGMAAGAALAIREVLTATDLRRRAGRLVRQEAQLRALVAGTGDVTMVLSEELVVRWQSPAAPQILGLADRDVVGRRFPDLVHPDEAAAVAERLRAVVAGGVVPPVMVAARLVDGTGGWRDTESSVSDLRQVPEVAALVVQVRDVGPRRQLEHMVHLLASTDQSTGLPNGRVLLRAITARRSGSHRRGAVVVIELHGLTAVCHGWGRAAGDAVLVEAARRLRAHVGSEDVAARLGEGQLAVVTLAGPIEAYALGAQLVAALTQPYQLPDQRPDRPVRLQVSVGLAPLSAGERSEEVVRRGELAVSRASQRGRNQVEWYDESLEEQLVRRLDLERHLPGAAGRGELDLVYQAVVELEGRRPVGVEALLRWRHPVLGRVLPCELIPVADQLRVSGEIGEWVLNTACRRAAAWREAGHDLWLAVNVSPRQLAGEDFVPGVAAALSVHQTPPERLTIEVSAADATSELAMVASQLSRVRGLGVRTALDHLGTGHTELGWLRRLPLDVVKLAIPPIAENTGGLVAAVVTLAGQLGLTVVAEGLEAESQRELVRQAGCRLGQGYLVSPPAPADRFQSYLDLARGVDIRSA